MITLTEEQLQKIIDSSIRKSVVPVVNATLKSLGIPTENDWLWISQAEASRLIGKGKASSGRRKLERAMAEGRVQFEKVNMDSRQGRVLVKLSDVTKLIKHAV